MPGSIVHEIASDLGIPSREVITILGENGVVVRSHMCRVDEDAVELLRSLLGRTVSAPTNADQPLDRHATTVPMPDRTSPRLSQFKGPIFKHPTPVQTPWWSALHGRQWGWLTYPGHTFTPDPRANPSRPKSKPKPNPKPRFFMRELIRAYRWHNDQECGRCGGKLSSFTSHLTDEGKKSLAQCLHCKTWNLPGHPW